MQKMRKWIVVLLVACLLWTSVGLVPASAAAENADANQDWTYNEESYSSKNTYYYYMEEHKDAKYPELEFSVDVTQFEVVEPDYLDQPSGTAVYENLEGSASGVNIRAKGEEVIFTVDVPETGLYCIALDYFPLADSNRDILFGLHINGKAPFTEANSCVLSRVFKNEQIQTDELTGDDMRPQSEQVSQWRNQFLYDQTGVYGNLRFYLEKGENKVSVILDGTPMLLENITFKQEEYLMSYQDYISLHQAKGYKPAESDQELLFQAEDYYLQSSSMLWPDADKSSPLTQPFSYTNTKINYGGGMQWKQPGQWISWKVNAPTDGFYNLGLKYKQGYLDGLFSSRKIYIDGEVPFAELAGVRFDYTGEWKNLVLGNEQGEAYSIYLTAGEHIITMENVIGDMTDTMGVLQTVMGNLNDLYLAIVMITSSDPDPYRDYYLEKQLPNLPDEFRKNAELLFEEAERLEELVGHKGAENAYFEDVAYNLQTYADNIMDLTYKSRLTNFKNDINGLSAKLSLYREQALDLDYIALLAADQQMPTVKLNAWQWIVYQIRSFFASFKDNNTKKTTTDEDVRSIRVWVGGGIDQFEIMKSMITDEFTPKTGIRVDLELSQASVVNALASGTGPDVVMNQNSEGVVNLALRGAVVDLSQFEGFWELLDQYVEDSEIPFMLEGRYYGMPNTNGCSVMFVRTDIFENLGLEIPQTWDDIYDVAQVLQRYNMTLGCAASYQNLLYQNGGTYFDDDRNPTKIVFDSEVSIDALIQHTEFYTKYGFPQAFDFTNRFRTGEMPIAITDYITYASLKYTAPEIAGLWAMYPVPGTPKEDGTIDRTQMDQTGTGVIMLRDCKDQDAAWEFIKWWSTAETQTRYGNDVEATLGISARYSSANLITIRSLGWTAKELATLEEQLKHIRFIPVVPGNYYVSRGLTNSLRGVIDNGENARELLTEWTIKVNDEIIRKRKEFYKNLGK